jgi:archaellum component FlaC
MPAATTPHNYITMEDLHELGENLHKRIVEDIADFLTAYMGHVDKRFNKIETRLDNVDARLGKVEIRLENVEVRLDGAVVKLDKLEAGQVTINNTLQNLNWD